MGAFALSAAVLIGTTGVAAAHVADDGGLGWSAASVRFEAPTSAGSGLTVAGSGTYRGAIEIRRNGRALAVVNQVGFEDYVRGIDEVPFGWPAAALQAQAIAARTYAAHRAANAEATPWRAVGADICATPRCQVYNGLDAERKPGAAAWVAAVRATAGRLLLSGGRPILASYSSTADGPLAMSQNGALEMANAGHSAADILVAYYGVAPTHAPGRLPATIRVALETGGGPVRVTGTGPFRVVDEDGTELAASATGDWKVAMDGDRVRVVPPHTDEPPSPVVTVPSTLPLAEVRRPGRVLSAAVPVTGHGPWATTAGLLVGATVGMATITLRRRRGA